VDPGVSVVIPTLSSRGRHLKQAVQSYEETVPNLDLIVIENDGRPCGIAWQEGAERAKGDYLHFSADDLVALPGWLDAALEIVAVDMTPAPVLYNPDGTLYSMGHHFQEVLQPGTTVQMSPVPFCSMKQWEKIGPMIPLHYYTDNWFSQRSWDAGWPVVLHYGYQFVHHIAQEGRVHERLDTDAREYAKHLGVDLD
jgi:hypothetical protein